MVVTKPDLFGLFYRGQRDYKYELILPVACNQTAISLEHTYFEDLVKKLPNEFLDKKN